MKIDFDYVRWDGIKNKLRLKYPMLTKSDLFWRHGTNEEMLEMIAGKLGVSTKNFKEEISKL